MNPDRIQPLQIEPDARRRPRRTVWLIFAGVVLITGLSLHRMWPRSTDDVRIVGNSAARSFFPNCVSLVE